MAQVSDSINLQAQYGYKIKTLDELPRTPKEPYWKSRKKAFANMVMETDDAHA